MLAGWYVQPGLLPDEQLAPSQSRITLRAEEKALRVISACSLQRMTPGTILNPRLFTEMLAQPSLRPSTYVLTRQNSEKLPEGRLDLEKEGECFAPFFLIGECQFALHLNSYSQNLKPHMLNKNGIFCFALFTAGISSNLQI